MHQGPGFVPRSSASARWSSGGGVHRGGSNPSAGTERSYDWSYERSLLMPPSRLRLSPCPCRETSIFNAGKAMWARGYAYIGCPAFGFDPAERGEARKGRGVGRCGHDAATPALAAIMRVAAGLLRRERAGGVGFGEG